MENKNLLVEVVNALRSKNEKVMVETTYAAQNSRAASPFMDTPQIPTNFGTRKNGPMSENTAYARSIKIGKISILKKNPEQTGSKYIVRTPNGDAEFSGNDIEIVWMAARFKCEHPNDTARAVEMLGKNLRDEDLRTLAKQGVIEGDKKSVYEDASKQLSALGVRKQPHLEKLKDNAMGK